MDLSDKEKAILQRIVTDDAFEILQKIANVLLVNMRQGTAIKETEFLTLVETVKREESKNILNNFLETIQKLSHGN